MQIWAFIFTFITMLTVIVVNYRLNRLEKKCLDLKNLSNLSNPLNNERLTTILDHVRVVERTLHTLSDNLSQIRNSAPKKPKK